MNPADELSLPGPELVDVVPVDVADALIAQVRQDLHDLNHQLEGTVLAADAAERQVEAVGADAMLVGRAAEQVQRFIEERRTATDQELKLLLDAAADQSRHRIDEARAEADRMTSDARRLAAPVSDGAAPAPAPAANGSSIATTAQDAPGRTNGAGAEPAQPDLSLWGELAALDDDEPEPDSGTTTTTTTTTDPALAPALRIGSIPVFALLQVAGLVVVLVVLVTLFR